MNRKLLTYLLGLGLLSLLCACEQADSPMQSLEVAARGVHSAALSNDGSMAIVGSIYHGGSLWNLTNHERRFNWNHKQDEQTTIVATDFSFDGRWAISADPATLVLWNTANGQGVRFWSAPGEILDVALGPGGQTALLGLSDHTAILFDIQRGGIRQILPHSNRVRSVDISRDGRLALTGSEDFTATAWDTRTGKVIARVKHDNDVQLVALSPDGATALSVSKYDKAVLWQTGSGKTINELPLTDQHLKRGQTFSAACFDKNNRFLLTGRPDQIVQLWALSEGTEQQRWKLPKRSPWKPTSAAVVALGFAPDSQKAFAISANGFIHWLDIHEANQ